MKVDWVHANEEHIRQIGEVLYSATGRAYVDEIVQDHGLVKLLDTHARTMLVDDVPILTIGGWPQWKGVMNVWMFTTPAIINHRISVIRQVRRYIEEIVEREKIHRLQAWVHVNYYLGMKFVEHYGFKPEGLMKQFTHDRQDMILYARIIQ